MTYALAFGFIPEKDHFGRVDKKSKLTNIVKGLSLIPGINLIVGLALTILGAHAHRNSSKPEERELAGVVILRGTLSFCFGPALLIADLVLTGLYFANRR